jgi:hypothetical protein
MIERHIEQCRQCLTRIRNALRRVPGRQAIAGRFCDGGVRLDTGMSRRIALRAHTVVSSDQTGSVSSA